MTTKGKILLIGGAVILPLAAIGAVAYGNNIANNVSVDFTGFNLTPPANGILEIRFDFDITNNTDLAFLIKGGNCNIFLNNEFLGVATLKEAQRVPKFSKVKISIWGAFTKDKVADYLGTAIGSILGDAGKMNFIINGTIGCTLDYPITRFMTFNKSINESFTM